MHAYDYQIFFHMIQRRIRPKLQKKQIRIRPRSDNNFTGIYYAKYYGQGWGKWQLGKIKKKKIKIKMKGGRKTEEKREKGLKSAFCLL